MSFCGLAMLAKYLMTARDRQRQRRLALAHAAQLLGDQLAPAPRM